MYANLCSLHLVLQILVVLLVNNTGQWWQMTTGHSSGQGNGLLTALWTLLLPTLLPGRSRFTNRNIRVNIKEKVEEINTSYNSDHIDKQGHLCIHLNMEGNTEVNMEGLNTGCDPVHVDPLCQASCYATCGRWIINWTTPMAASAWPGRPRCASSTRASSWLSWTVTAWCSFSP